MHLHFITENYDLQQQHTQLIAAIAECDPYTVLRFDCKRRAKEFFFSHPVKFLSGNIKSSFVKNYCFYGVPFLS
jgi:hypothetical protein